MREYCDTDLGFAIGVLLELGNKESIHVVHVGVDTLAEFDTRVEALLLVVGEAWVAHLEASLNQLDKPVLERVVDDPLVFLDTDGASGVPTERLVRMNGHSTYTM